VVPPDENGYGAVLGQTIRIARTMHQRFLRFAETIRNEFIVQPLAEPDTNILIYAFNPAGNRELHAMNRFGLALFKELSVDPAAPIQTRRFIISHTELSHDHYNAPALRAFLQDKMGVPGSYFVPSVELGRRRAAGDSGYDDGLVVLRTTLMNPFLLEPVRGEKDYLELFLETLPPLLRKVQRTLEISTPLRVPASLELLAQIRRFVKERGTTLGVDPDTLSEVVLAVDEAATNAILHGYAGREGFLEIEVGLEGDALVIRLRDEAAPFDLATVPPPDLSAPAEERVLEGMGIYLIRQAVDELSHRTTLERGNELTLVKRGIGPT
jgi:anti-sigma regulatory factor (Ser/Thr protein kinase)